MTYDDAGMYGCENDHTYCIDHELDLTEETSRSLVKKVIDRGWSKPEQLKIYETALQEGKVNPDWMKENEFLKSHFDDRPWELCPVCNLSSITSSMTLQYLLKKLKVNSKEVEEEIRSLYNNYNEMKEVLKK
jgi:hypothetical protein